ncbi:Putative Cytochrome oxidase subunit II [Bradyrhizobium sp. ORS 285]|uniref:cytochrome c oxidase subunit II n=1 Tax=Bradyrhizobium sp. ORS 285 TaxID=115808 RepID=UPI0002405BD1|nr:cytochrome c oxidase subunit II [Bradyrhizobium sp. ORS 285]CCD85408.1 putative Cytochrome oxidase subunit II [Bradyrhizobium sp. ORS 285]SMX60003.1 Putative Cytochrome oxidase subunit II [Bradyrhizobium sp. ORS 285]
MTRRIGPALAMLSLLLLGGCSNWQSALDARGASAISLKHLIVLIVAVCSVVWALVMIAMIYALWRRRAAWRAPLDLRAPRERRIGWIVSICVGLTAVIIVGFTVASFFTTRNISVAGQDDLTIRIGGLQWWWSVEYLAPDPARGIVSANEIHIPTGRNVRLLLQGDDVIHSFWVPSLAGKQDLIPGRTNEITIRADRPGTYRGQCAEFCGLQHAHMGFLVMADTPEDFARWIATQRTTAASTNDDEEIAAGRDTFMRKPCAGCHAIRGTQATGTSGPDLTHVGSRAFIAAGLLPTSRGALAAWIADPQTLKPGNNMPLVSLTPDELRAVSAYLASLK